MNYKTKQEIIYGIVIGLILSIPMLIRSANLNTTSHDYTIIHNHTEKPAGNISALPGIDYEITQIFFEVDKTDDNEKAIKQILDNTGLVYENLYYTNFGYYTADIRDLKHLSYDNYLKTCEIIEESVKKVNTIAVHYVIQAYYKHL